MVSSARLLALVWALFWVWFGLASGIAEGGGFRYTLIHTALPGLVFLAIALLAWRWEALGGTALVVIGLAVLVGYPLLWGSRFPLSTVVQVVATMALPPMGAGILLLRHRCRTAHLG
jgi:hypothetical protein